MKKLWGILVILAVLTPVGLWLPEHFGAGGAWGEWGAEELKEVLGYVPEGLEKLNGLWRAPLGGYLPEGGAAGYVLSAIVGFSIVVLASFLLGRVLVKGKRRKDGD